MSLCERQPIRQISTGTESPTTFQQLAARDLETLFQRSNDQQLCLNKLSKLATSLTNGSFAGGDGSTSSPGGSGGGPGTSGTTNPLIARTTSGSNVLLPDAFTGIAVINATADITVTLPNPRIDFPITVMNVGATHTITVKDNLGSTINPPILAGGWMVPQVVEDATNASTYSSGAMVIYPDGTMQTPSYITFVGAGIGPVVQSPDTNYQLLGSSNVPAPTATAKGATPPL